MIPRIAVCSYFMNAGSTCRAVEIAKAVRKRCGNDSCEICFFSYRTEPGSCTYEHVAHQEGFPIEYFPEITINDDLWRAILSAEHTPDQEGGGYLPGSYKDRALPHLEAVVNAFKQYQPTIILQGLFPEVSLAAQILQIPSIRFGPLPSNLAWMKQHLLASLSIGKDKNEESTPVISKRAGDPTQFSMFKAARQLGWTGTNMYQADEYIVCDLPSNWEQTELRSDAHLHIVGPVFAGISSQQKLSKDEEVETFLTRHNTSHPKVFVTMASSGGAVHLREAVEACVRGKFCALVSMPTNAALGDTEGLPEYILTTNAFLPLTWVCSRVDVVVCHGGQGTIQSVLSQGTPIVGKALQMEQAFNLRNLRGAGLELEDWAAEKIRTAILEVVKNPLYRDAAEAIAKEMAEMDGPGNAADVVLAFVRKVVVASHEEDKPKLNGRVGTARTGKTSKRTDDDGCSNNDHD